MIFSDIEMKVIKKELEEFLDKRRPPVEMRHRLDVSYKIENRSILIYEIRPFLIVPDGTGETPIAKATFDKPKNVWKIYLPQPDLKWHVYEPVPCHYLGRSEQTGSVFGTQYPGQCG